MNWDANSVIAVMTAATTLITAIGGTIIAVKQSGMARKIEDAKTAAATVASKIDENANTRSQQIADLKQTVLAKGPPA